MARDAPAHGGARGLRAGWNNTCNSEVFFFDKCRGDIKWSMSNWHMDVVWLIDDLHVDELGRERFQC